MAWELFVQNQKIVLCNILKKNKLTMYVVETVKNYIYFNQRNVLPF